MEGLESLGMVKGLLYETIITTKNASKTANAAPIGVICKGKKEVVVHLHEGSHTLRNIKEDGRFVVNILKDPLIFMECTIGNPPSAYFDKHKNDFYIKDADAFFTANVVDLKEVVREDKLGASKISIIKAEVEDLIKKKEHVEPINRAIFAILEALIYLTRMDIADEDTSEVYSERIHEMSRIVNRVGGLDDKKAMKKILKSLEKK